MRSAPRCDRRSRLRTCCCRSNASATPRRTARTCCTSHRTAPSPWWPSSGCPGRRPRSTTTSSWCVVGVYEGAEHETRYRLTRDGHLVESGSAIAFPGDVAGLLPPGDIHRVHNTSDTTAISLHVYGADLTLGGSSIRRVYPESLTR